MSETPNDPNVETHVETHVDNGNDVDPKHAGQPDPDETEETPGESSDDESSDDDDDESPSSS